jgi:hypothetical protein
MSSGSGLMALRQESLLSDGKLPNLQKDRDLQKIGTATTLGFGVAISLAVMVGGGIWLDRRLDLAPVFTLIGLALGLLSAGYQLYELALLNRQDRDSGPVGRALERRFSRRVTPRT